MYLSSFFFGKMAAKSGSAMSSELIAQIYCRLEGGLDAALVDMEKALAIRRELAETDPTTFQPLVEKTLRELEDLPRLARDAKNRRAARDEAERLRSRLDQ